jgi:hypothetical protein
VQHQHQRGTKDVGRQQQQQQQHGGKRASVRPEASDRPASSHGHRLQLLQDSPVADMRSNMKSSIVEEDQQLVPPGKSRFYMCVQ